MHKKLSKKRRQRSSLSPFLNAALSPFLDNFLRSATKANKPITATATIPMPRNMCKIQWPCMRCDSLNYIQPLHRASPSVTVTIVGAVSTTKMKKVCETLALNMILAKLRYLLIPVESSAYNYYSNA